MFAAYFFKREIDAESSQLGSRSAEVSVTRLEDLAACSCHHERDLATDLARVRAQFTNERAARIARHLGGGLGKNLNGKCESACSATLCVAQRASGGGKGVAPAFEG